MKQTIVFISKSKKLSINEKNNLYKFLINRIPIRSGEPYKKRINILCDKIYKKHIGKYANLLNQMPDNWKITTNTMYIHGRHRSKCLLLYTSNKKEYPILKSGYAYNIILDPDKDKKLIKELEKIDQDYLKMRKKYDQLMTNISTALNQINTTKQLFESWPEAYKIYLELFPPKNNCKTICIPVTQLNKELGL